MKSITRKYFFLSAVFMVLCFSHAAKGQNVCTQVLKNAQESYDAGKINYIPAMLDSCMKEGFTRAEKISALRLLILTYLFQDEDYMAEKTLLVLFKEDPEYKVNEAIDPAEFIYLYNKYRTLPLISIGVCGGVNQSRVSQKEKFSTENTNSSKAKYKPGYGYQFGLTADILLYKKLQLNVSVLYSGKKYEMTRDNMFGYSTLNLVENQSWLELPLAFKYNFGKIGIKKLIPFVELGVSANLFLSSNANITRTSNEGKDIDASGPSVKMTDLRNRFNYSAMLSAGLRYKIGYGYAILDVRYNLGMYNIVKIENRYSNNELLYYYGHVDSDYTLNNVSISLGYLKSIYKPKKIKVENE